jgi:magnesium-transporting ATPase (P-type)
VELGLTGSEAAERLARYGPNAIRAEKPPSVWQVALGQLRDPMNIMLVAVVSVSFVIGEVSTAVVVGLLLGVAMAISAIPTGMRRRPVRTSCGSPTGSCLPIAHARAEIDAANAHMGEDG